MISWSDNLLRKIVGYYQLSLKQASSIQINNKSSINIPGCRQDQIDLVTQALYGSEAFENIEMEAVDIRFMYRRMMFLSLLGIPPVAIGYFNDNFIPIFGGFFVTMLTVPPGSALEKVTEDGPLITSTFSKCDVIGCKK